MSVTAGKRSQSNPQNEPSHSNIKRPKRAEVNFLPNFPLVENQASLNNIREEIAEEMKKTEKSTSFINAKMQTTFALR